MAKGEAYLGRVVDGASRVELAEVRFALARALWQEAPARRAEARAAALLARDGFAQNGAVGARSRAAVDAWLAEHPLP